MSISQMMLLHKRVEFQAANTDGVTIVDVTLNKQNASSISDGWVMNTDGTWHSRAYPGYGFTVDMGDGTWHDGTHASSYYEIRYSRVSGDACYWDRNYGYCANFNGNWYGGGLNDHMIYGHTAHSPPLQWDSSDKVLIEVRRASDQVVLAEATITFAA